jgi:hypothetical protein
MRRLAALPLCVCLAAPLWSGCQSTSHRTARVDRAQPATFWSADGGSQTRLVSGRSDGVPTRLASRSSRDGNSLGGLISGRRPERVPLPRTAARDIDSARGSADEPIGAF